MSTRRRRLALMLVLCPVPIAVETVKLILLSYLYHGDALMRCAVPWDDVTATLTS